MEELIRNIVVSKIEATRSSNKYLSHVEQLRGILSSASPEMKERAAELMAKHKIIIEEL